MAKKQSGYFDIDVMPLVITALIVGVVGGVLLRELLRWLWPFVKAAIHAWTA